MPESQERRLREVAGAPGNYSSEATVTLSAGAVKQAVELISTAHERERAAGRREYARGYRAGCRRGEEAGALRAIAALKRINADLPAGLALEAARWGPRGRLGFALPREGDFPGRGDAT